MLARFPGAWGPAQQLKCWSKDGNPASHGTVQLRLRKPSNAPQGQRIGGYGSVLRPGPMGLRRNKKLKRLAGSQPVRVAGSRAQGPVGQVSRGLGARAPRAWGPAHQGPGAFSPQKPPGRKRSRDTPPTPPPPPPPPRFGAVREKGRGFSPSPPSATIQHAPQGRRICLR